MAEETLNETVVEETVEEVEKKEPFVKRFLKTTTGKVVAAGLGLVGALGGGYALGKIRSSKKTDFTTEADYLTYEDVASMEGSDEIL